MTQSRARAPRCCGYNPYPGAVPKLKSGRSSNPLGGTKGSIVQGGARGCGFIGMTWPRAEFESPWHVWTHYVVATFVNGVRVVRGHDFLQIIKYLYGVSK